MGNQREIRQVLPYEGLGAILPVRAGRDAEAARLLDECTAPGGFLTSFYTHLYPAGEPIRIYNMDGPERGHGPLPCDCIGIPSGGKMWCGYENFVEHLRVLAPLVEDALFFVGDEEDYVDRFRITDGVLYYSRVHEGFWWPVDEFIDQYDPIILLHPY